MIKKSYFFLLISLLERLCIYGALFFLIMMEFREPREVKQNAKRKRQRIVFDRQKGLEKRFWALDQKQQEVLEMFTIFSRVSAKQMSNFFNWTPRCCTRLCQIWTKNNFFEIDDPSNRCRKYRLSKEYRELLDALSK